MAMRLSGAAIRSEEHTSELQSRFRNLVCRLLLEKKKVSGPLARPGVSGVQAQRQHARTPRRMLSDQTATVLSAHAVELSYQICIWFFFNDTAPTEIYPLSLHDALPI